MHKYVVQWESCSGQPASKEVSMDGGLQMTMLTEPFGDRSKFPYGMALSVLLSKEELTWKALTS